MIRKTKFCRGSSSGFLMFSICFMALFLSSAYAGDPSGYRLYSVENKSTHNHMRWQRCVPSPTSLAVDFSGTLYVTEAKSNSLFVYSEEGKQIKKLEGLDRPISVAVDKRGKIYIGNAGRSNVEVYDSHLSFLYKLGSGDGEFAFPSSIAVDSSGSVYVTDSKHHRVKIYNSRGSSEGSLAPEGTFKFPASIAVNRRSGELIVSDFDLIQDTPVPVGKPRIRIFDSKRKLMKTFDVYGKGEEKISGGMQVSVDSGGNIYVVDSRQNVIEIFDTSGKYLGIMYDLDNSLRMPMSIAIDENDVSFVASLNMGLIEVAVLSNGKGEQHAKRNNVNDKKNANTQKGGIIPFTVQLVQRQ